MEQAVLDHVTDELKADPVVWPILEKMSEKDIPSVLKSYAHSQQRLGNAVNLPGKDAKPEDVAGFKAKLYDAGLFIAPPEKPEAYGIQKPENMADGLGWNDELAGDFATTLHKHGATKGLAEDLLTLYNKSLSGAQGGLKTSYDEGIAALKTEHGADYDTRREAAGRLAKQIFLSEEEVAFFDRTGLGDHPKFLSILMRLAPLAMQDSSVIPDQSRPSGAESAQKVREEVADIMNNKENPKHKPFWNGDRATQQYIDGLYKKAYGDAKVDLSGGIVVGGPEPK